MAIDPAEIESQDYFCRVVRNAFSQRSFQLPDQFVDIYKANDGTVDSNIATVQVNVAPVNDAPVANNGSLTIAEDSTGTVVLTSSDIEGDAITYHLDSLPKVSEGTVSLSGNSVIFTPAQFWNGSTTFTFYAKDAKGAKSNSATVSVTVTPAPAGDQAILQPTFLEARFEDGSRYREALPGEIVTVTIKYREPNTSKAIRIFGGYSVTQSTSFIASDYTSSIFSINPDTSGMILAEPGLPHDCRLNSNSPCTDFSTQKTYTMKFKVSESMIRPAWIGYEFIDGKYVATQYPASQIPYGSRKIVVAPLWGPPCNELKPAGGLTYKCERPINMDMALTLNILGGDKNKVPIAQDVSITTQEETPASVSLVAEDQEGDPFTFSLVAGPNAAHGAVAISGGKATYSPALNWSGTTTFTYKASDAGGDSNVATVNVAVTPINDPPVPSGPGLEITTTEQRPATVIYRVNP